MIERESCDQPLELVSLAVESLSRGLERENAQGAKGQGGWEAASLNHSLLNCKSGRQRIILSYLSTTFLRTFHNAYAVI